MASFKNDFLSTLYCNWKIRMCQYLYGYNQNNVQMMMTGADDDDDDDGRTDQINTKNYTLYMY